jgi:uncharacterized protein (UPF0264 family)
VANAASRSYGAANPVLTGTVSGFVNGDTVVSATTGTLGFTTGAGATSGVGTYAVTGGGLTANHGNYVFTEASANATALTITPASLGVTYSVANASSTYGTLATVGAVTLTGLLNGDTVRATVGVFSGSTPVALAANTAAGSYTEKVTALNNPNYTLASSGNTNGTLTINPATLTYLANPASRTYGAANPMLSGTVSGFVAGDTLASATSGAITFSTAATPNSNAGSYAITGGGLAANNYVFVQAPANAAALTINPAPITVAALGGSSTYGGTPSNPGLSATGLQNGQNASVLTGLSNSFGITNTTNAGSHTLNVAGTLTNSNYVVTGTSPGTWTVTPATLTYVANPASTTYGSSIPPLSGTVSGFVNGDTISSATTGTLGFTTTATSGSNIGNYAVIGAGLTANDGNYIFTQAPGNATAFSIVPVPPPATASNSASTGNYGTQQTALLTPGPTFTNNVNQPPLFTPIALGGFPRGGSNGNTAGVGGTGGPGGSGGITTGTVATTGSLANGLHGGNGAPLGTRLIDMPVIPLPPGSGMPPPGETHFVSNEVVVQFRPGMSPQEIADIASQFGLTLVGTDPIGFLGRSIYRYTIPNGQTVRSIIRAVEAQNLPLYIQPEYNSYRFAQEVTSIPGPSELVGDPAQYVIGKFHLGESHRLTKGDNVVIAVIDSEIDSNHPDLAGVVTNRFDAGCGATGPDAHGTGMTGAIAAHKNLMGIAPNVKVIAVCAFGGDAATAESTSIKIIRGLDYAIQQGARVINMSFAGPRDPTLAQALQIAREKSILLVGAAGNAGPKSPPLFPGADPNVLAVTATDDRDRLFRGANQGNYIAVAAPGVDILVPAPGNSIQLTTGTSVATAHVSGVAALLIAQKPKLTPEEIRRILVTTGKAPRQRHRHRSAIWRRARRSAQGAAVRAAASVE